MAAADERSHVTLIQTTCSHIREPLEEIGDASSALVSLKCRTCGCLVSPCLACCAPIRLQDQFDSSPNEATINGGTKTETGVEFVTEDETETVTCDCCGAINPGRLERSLLGLPQKQAMAAPLVRRMQGALFGRRAYLLSKRREQAFCREVLVKASACLAPTEKPSHQGRKRVSLTLSSDTDSVPFSDFLGHNPTAPSPLPLSSQNDTQKGGLPSSSETLSQRRKVSFSHSKRNLHQEMEEEQEEQRYLKKRRFSLDSKSSTPFKGSDLLETEEGRPNSAKEDHRNGKSFVTDPANRIPSPGQSPHVLTTESLPQKNMGVHSEKEAFELVKSTQKAQIHTDLLSGKEAFDAKVVRCSNAILSLQCYMTLVEDLKRPVLELPIFCEFCPNNVAFEIQNAFRNYDEGSGSEEHSKPEEAKVVTRPYPIGSGQVAVLQASYFWLESSHGGVNGIKDLLKQVTEFVGERERLMEMERGVKWAKDVAELAEADCDALKERRLMSEKERVTEKGSHEERNKQQSSTSSIVVGDEQLLHLG